MADILSEEQEGSSKPKLMFGTEVLASKVLREDLLIKAKKSVDLDKNFWCKADYCKESNQLYFF